MRLRVTFPILATLLVLANCGETESPSQAPQPTPQAQAMRHMLADVDRIRAFLYGSGNQAGAASAASDLVAWARQMPTLFPPELASRQYVDMSPERAKAATAAINREAGLLLAAVQTGDHAAIGDRLAETERNGCGACHLNSTQ